MARIGYLAKFNFTPEDLQAWWKLRAKYRARNHVCRFCKHFFQHGEVKIVDHIKPHRGDLELFLNPSNLQLLCKKCHDSKKQIIERNASKPEVGLDGWQK